MESVLTTPDQLLDTTPGSAFFQPDNAASPFAQQRGAGDSRIRESATRDATAAHLPVLLVLDEDEQTHSTVEMSSGDLARILHATNPLEAFRWLRDETVDVVIGGTANGCMDLTHLLCLAKRRHPDIASIVVSTEASPALARLTMQGLIFCHLAKPLKAGQLRARIKAALSTPTLPPVALAPSPRGKDEARPTGWLGALHRWFRD